MSLIRTKLFFLFLLLSLTGFGGVKIDSLYLYNGNVVTGEIKKMEYGVLSFGTDDVGTLSVNWPEVRKLKSGLQFELTLKDNRILEGSIDTSANPRELLLVLDDSILKVSLDDLVKIVSIKNSFKSRIDGNINFGLSYSKGSRNIKYNLTGNIRYRSLHDLIELSGNSNITRDKRQEDTVLVTKKQDMKLSYSRYFYKRWYIQSYFGLDQNTELGLNLRMGLGVAGGKELFQNKIHALSTGVGFLGTQEKPVSGEKKLNFESAVSVEYRIYKHTYPKVLLSNNIFVVPSLSNLGRIRISTETDVDFEFFKDFIFSINTYQSYDNRPATAGASKYDWGVSTSIGYSF